MQEYGGSYNPWDWDFHKSWPEPGEVPDYPEDDLKTARAIFREAHAILFRAQYDSAEKPYNPWYGKDNGDSELRIGPDQAKTESVMYYANTMIGVSDNVKDYEVYAILAIEEAWSILYDIFIEGISKDDLNIINQTHNAELLMIKSDRLHTDIAIKKIQPDAKLGEKIRKQRSEFGKRRSEESAMKKELIIRKANQIKNSRPELSGRSIASYIFNEYKDELSLSEETIRKYIEPALKKMGK